MMKEIKAKEVMKMFENQNVVNRTEFTFEEYIQQLSDFQAIVSACLFDGDESYHLSNSVTRLEELARGRNMKENPTISESLKNLKKVNKELAILLAGKKGENRIMKTLGYVQRPDLSVYKNVYITDGEEETEIDTVLVTNNGIIILEIKSAKQDITIAEDGRLLYENEISYHNVSIGEKMEKKRRLLKYKIEQEMKNRGIKLPVRIESRIVFSTPYKVRITVTDLYKKERFCYKSQLNKQVENFYSGTYYESEDLSALNDIITSMERNKKRFQQQFDFAKINSEFAQMMELLTMPEKTKSAEKTVLSEQRDEKFCPQPTARHRKNHRRQHIRCRKHLYTDHTESCSEQKNSTNRFEVVNHVRRCHRINHTRKEKQEKEKNTLRNSNKTHNRTKQCRKNHRCEKIQNRFGNQNGLFSGHSGNNRAINSGATSAE